MSEWYNCPSCDKHCHTDDVDCCTCFETSEFRGLPYRLVKGCRRSLEVASTCERVKTIIRGYGDALIGFVVSLVPQPRVRVCVKTLISVVTKGIIRWKPSIYQGVQRIISPLTHLFEGGGGVYRSARQIPKPIEVGKNL